MGSHLVIRVQLHDRFHGMALGAPEWPPSPARLFQALVAGVAEGRRIPERYERAFEWLERLPPPRIVAPPSKQGSPRRFFVPNNDLDSKGGDLARLAEIRVQKTVVPRILESGLPILYVWRLNEDLEQAGRSERIHAVLDAADALFQFGRGIDPAWAQAEVLDEAAVRKELGRHPGIFFDPGGHFAMRKLFCPLDGSYESLRSRFDAPRFESFVEGRSRRELFLQAPKPRFRLVEYGRGVQLRLFRIVEVNDGSKAYPIALCRAFDLVTKIRDAAVDRLRHEFPKQASEIERILVGRKPDGSNDGPIEERVWIMPLPSIGHSHADRAIRRIAVQLPGGSALLSEDIAWAFDGLAPYDPVTGEVGSYVLVREDDRSMVNRYTRRGYLFRSVTPLALPAMAQRRRIDPARRGEEAKGASERIEEAGRAMAAVRTALRHAGIVAPVEWIRVQREPFERRGERAERFAEDTRFSKQQLWHAEIRFAKKVLGPVVLGDGRFLGLGVMYPVEDASVSDGIWGFAVEPDPDARDVRAVVQAFRRAVMSRVGERLGRGRMLAAYFSGHEEDGAPTTRAHLSFQWDPLRRRLLILAPHRLEGREERVGERANRRHLEAALEGFHELRAGSAGRFTLRALRSQELMEYDCAAQEFESATPYAVNRHGRKTEAHALLSENVVFECRRRGLPIPRVTVLEAHGVPGLGLTGTLRLHFDRPVKAPLVLGRTRYLGGGLFLPLRPDPLHS